MTPTELRQQADNLLQRGLFRRAANVLLLITTHIEATEAERDSAQAQATRILVRSEKDIEDARRARHAELQRARRAAAKEAAKSTTGKRGDGMRAVQKQIREAREIRQQWKGQQ